MLPTSHTMLTILAVYLICDFTITTVISILIMTYEKSSQLMQLIEFIIFFVDCSIFASLIFVIFQSKYFFGKNYYNQKEQAQAKILQLIHNKQNVEDKQFF